MNPTTKKVRQKTRKGLRADKAEFCAAGRGTLRPGVCASPAATGSPQAPATSASVFVVPGSKLFWILSSDFLGPGVQGREPLVEFGLYSSPQLALWASAYRPLRGSGENVAHGVSQGEIVKEKFP